MAALTRADRLYRVWLERELGRITTEEAFERVERVMCEPDVFVPVRWIPPPKSGCAGCGCDRDEQTRNCLTCSRRHEKRRQVKQRLLNRHAIRTKSPSANGGTYHSDMKEAA